MVNFICFWFSVCIINTHFEPFYPSNCRELFNNLKVTLGSEYFVTDFFCWSTKDESYKRSPDPGTSVLKRCKMILLRNYFRNNLEVLNSRKIWHRIPLKYLETVINLLHKIISNLVVNTLVNKNEIIQNLIISIYFLLNETIN